MQKERRQTKLTDAMIIQRETMLMCFAGFRETSWERNYAEVVSQIVGRTAVERESALDLGTMQYIILRSIDHERAQAAIACGYVEIVAPHLGAIFGLGLSAFPTRYARGEVFGVLSMPLTQQEMIAKVEAAMERRCGAVPDLANPDDGIPILEWLTWCVEVMKSGDPQHLPEGDVEQELAQIYQKCGATKRIIEVALDQTKVPALSRSPGGYDPRTRVAGLKVSNGDRSIRTIESSGLKFLEGGHS
jgi:hypothetical protein